VLELAGPKAFEKAFSAAANAKAEAVINSSGRFITLNPKKFLAVAAQYRLLTMCHHSVLSQWLADVYGPNFPDLWRRAAE
jgi:hypothetical protein